MRQRLTLPDRSRMTGCVGLLAIATSAGLTGTSAAAAVAAESATVTQAHPSVNAAGQPVLTLRAPRHLVAASQDATVEAARPRQGRGAAPSATLSAAPRQASEYYLTFSSKLPRGAVVTSAVLSLTTISRSAGGLVVHPVPVAARSWTETGLSWATQPHRSSVGLATARGPFVPGQRLAVRLPSSAVQTGSRDTDLRLTAATLRSVRLATDEYADAASRPELIVTYRSPVTQYAYLKFPTSMPAGRGVASADLAFTATTASRGTVVVSAVPGSGASAWSGSTLTWAHQPPLSSVALASIRLSGVAHRRYTVHLPSAVVEQQATDLRLWTTTDEPVSVAGANYSDVAQRPALRVVLGPTSTPPVTTAPTTAAASPAAPSTTPDTSCAATLTTTGGTPWRSGACSSPGYGNVPIRQSPVLDVAASRIVSSLPGAMLNMIDYGEPVYYATSSTPQRRVNCTTYACVGGTSARVDGTWRPAPGSDGQLTVVDLAARRTYEFWQIRRKADGTVAVAADGSVSAGHMSVGDLDGRGNRTAAGSPLEATGAGVSRAFGVITEADVRAAAVDPATAIRHGLQLSLPGGKNCASFREPATKSDGGQQSGCVPEGAHLQLDRGVSCGQISGTKLTRAICYALQTYGGYDTDNNGSNRIAFYGQTPSSGRSGAIPYASVGVSWDYQNLDGLPMGSLRVLAHWDGS